MGAAKVLGILLLAGGLGPVLTACAGAPLPPGGLVANDPYESTNRDILAFNTMLDHHLLRPAVQRYIVLPDGVRRGVHNFLVNLTKPTTFVNDLLQGEATRGSQTAERFLVNTTIGLGGLVDVAGQWRMPDHGEDFGQTLAVWGAGEGPFLMLPFFGPSNPRDVAGLVADTLGDPTNFVHFKQHIWWALGREYFTLLDLRTQNFQTIQDIQRSSVDYYASLRSLYRQRRTSEIHNGRAAGAPELPDF